MDDMIMQKAKERVRAYRVQFNLLTILSALIALVPTCWVVFVMRDHFWLILVSCLLYLFLRRIIAFRLYNKFIMAPLIHEMDPTLYRAILLEAKWAAYPGVDHMFAAYYHGEYQTVIDLCANKMADPKCQRFTLFYLLELASTYFELNDMAALRRTLDHYDAYLATRKDGDALRQKYQSMQYYRAYADGDYAACRVIIEPLIRKGDLLLYHVEFSFLHALACYRLGDLTAAQSSFAFVVQNAPKLHFCTIAQKYLDAMERGEDYCAEVTTLTPDPAYQPLSFPARRRTRRVLYILLGIELVLLLFIVLLRSFLG